MAGKLKVSIARTNTRKKLTKGEQGLTIVIGVTLDGIGAQIVASMVLYGSLYRGSKK